MNSNKLHQVKVVFEILIEVSPNNEAMNRICERYFRDTILAVQYNRVPLFEVLTN